MSRSPRSHPTPCLPVCLLLLQGACGNGPMCDEQVRGICVKVLDVVLHADAIHRGMGQIMPTARRVVHACMLTASPGTAHDHHLQHHCPCPLASLSQPCRTD